MTSIHGRLVDGCASRMFMKIAMGEHGEIGSLAWCADCGVSTPVRRFPDHDFSVDGRKPAREMVRSDARAHRCQVES